MATKMRNRAGADSKIFGNSHNNHTEDQKYKQRASIYHPQLLWFAILLFYGVVYEFIHIRNGVYPTPKTLTSAGPGEFVEERARQNLIDIANLGDRFVGSDANEKFVVEYLVNEINKIKERTTAAHDLQVDIQKTTGSFSLPFLSPFTSYYHNVQNVIVKFAPSGGAPDSLLVNCHYDSVLDSPGASDDAVTCCLMLETLRILSQRKKPLQHNIVYIFNGAEENILQASHGFITQHKWAREVRAFVNLDSAGAGGRELLFQAGPGHPWMIQMYAEKVPYPFASVFGQEVFESGLIPSDTDYRIYRDFGNLPGVDIAYIQNGYVYHTKFDHPGMIPPGCIQRGGENLLALISAIGDSPLLAEPGDYRHGSLVFFDVVGMFMVAYPARVGYIINAVVAAICFMSIYKKITSPPNGPGFRGKMYAKHLIMAMVVNVVAWLITIATVLLLSYGIFRFGQPMSWFTHNWLMIGLYMIPAVMVLIIVHSLAKQKLYRTVNSMWDVESVHFDTFMLTLCVWLVVMTYNSINSAALLLIFVLFPLITRQAICPLLNLTLRDRPLPFLCLHLGGVLPPSLLFLYFMHGVYTMFTPLMGRVGTVLIPDMFIAAISSIVILVLLGYQVGLVYVSGNTKGVLRILASIFAVSLVLATYTSLGFPYRADQQQPTRQRHIIKHTQRIFHDHTSAVVKEDSMIWHIPFDKYALTPLQAEMPSLHNPVIMNCTASAPYCGQPFYFPMADMLKHNYIFAAAPLKVNSWPKYHIINRQHMKNDNIERITFKVTGGPTHQSVLMMPKNGVDLVRWSLGNGQPVSGSLLDGAERDTYFVYYSRGLKSDDGWDFWIDLKYDENLNTEHGVLDIAFCGHYFHDDRMSDDLRRYLDAMPDWTTPVGWSVTYESWVV